ncbi:MAG: glycosyltransferase family 4 protein [Rhodospirillales bacterium]|nr:glycosyltransferase family 4 protein [Rhodospirillales bacterium]
MGRAVGFVLKGYPRLSETFIAQEILALERRGLDIRIISLRHPTDAKRHAVHDEIRAPVSYLPEYLYQEPWRVLRAWTRVRRWPGYRAAWRAWLKDLRRDFTPNRGRRFGQALVLAHELPAEVGALHAHFLHTPASVARYAGLMHGLPWSFSAHAKDIWTTPEWEKREKLNEARWGVTCTASGAAHLKSLAPRADLELVYHGLDLGRFPPIQRALSPRDGRDPQDPVRLLSVGRMVEKKGADVLIEALALLPKQLEWRLEHVGGGPLSAPMKKLAQSRGIADRIRWLGPLTQAEVLERYRAADLFVLASRIAADGDRDGLPNVLMEAQSQCLAVLATDVSAIPELIEDGTTGRLVAPEDPRALAAALAQLIGDPALRARLGRAGQDRVRSRFSMEAGIASLGARFGIAADSASAAAGGG